jgi:predicted amidohydrolase YtcJ
MFTFSGFRDGHSHPLFASRESDGPSLDGCGDPSEIQEVLRNYLADHPESTWLDCGSYSPEFEAKHLPTREILDAVSTQVPIVVHAADHHSILVNTAALVTADVFDEPPVFPAAASGGARFDLDANGKPTGIVREWDAMNTIYAKQPKPTLEADLGALSRAQERMLSRGIVAVQDAWIDPGMVEPYLEFARLGELKMRVNLAPRIDQSSWRDTLDFAKASRSQVRALGNPLLTCNTVKVFIDGVTSSGTAAYSEPYCDGHTAAPIWQREQLLAMVTAADSAGFQLHFHAIGDAAIALAIDVVDELELINGPVDRRPVLAHAELVPLDQLAKARRAGFVFCAQPHWALPSEDQEHTQIAIGAERTALLHPLRSLLEAGLRLSFGSDWPVSAPEPLEAIYAAVYGHSNPESTVSRKAALQAHSEAVAYQLGHEQAIGEDEVTLDRNILECDEAELKEATVLNVKVAGRTVWSASH